MKTSNNFDEAILLGAKWSLKNPLPAFFCVVACLIAFTMAANFYSRNTIAATKSGYIETQYVTYCDLKAASRLQNSGSYSGQGWGIEDGSDDGSKTVWRNFTDENELGATIDQYYTCQITSSGSLDKLKIRPGHIPNL